METTTHRLEPRIEPVREADIATLVQLARDIWYRHYPNIVSVEQIEYMLGQRYHPDAIRAQLASERAWLDKLMLNDVMVAFSSCELSEHPA